MRMVARLLVGVFAVLALFAAALFLLRKEAAAAAIEHALAGARIENPDVRVTGFSMTRLVIGSLRAGADPSAPALALNDVVADFNWRELVFEGEINLLTINGGEAVVAIDDKGAFNIAGWSPDPNARRAPPPFRTLKIPALAVTARTPRGDARLNVVGDFDYQKGGEFALALDTARAGMAAASLDEATGEATLGFGADGAIILDGAIKGALATPAGTVRDLAADIEATLASWRGIFGEGSPVLEGGARLTMKSSTLDAATTPTLAPFAGGATPIKTLALTGVLSATIAEGGVALALDGDPLSLVADRGDRLVVEAGEGALYARRGGIETVSLNATLDGPVAAGLVTLAARAENGGPWRIDADAMFDDQKIADVMLGAFSGSFTGDFGDNRLSGVAEFVASVKEAEIGRLQINDMPAAGRADVALDLAAKTLSASPTEEACFAIAKAAFRMAAQDMDARVTDASFCAGAAPLVTVSWNGPTLAHLDGVLNARSARYRLGRTEFDGAPPRVDFTLDYAPSVRTTRARGAITGGRAILNKSLILSESNGLFEAELAGAELSAKAQLASMKIAQNAKPELVAPVAVSGGATLSGDVARFDFAVKTPTGQALGIGEGRHEVRTGRGEAVFSSGAIVFSPALQPDRLFPSLRGVISSATGAADGRVRFEWTPKLSTSTATIELKDVSFGGPGVAVTRTSGVNGTIAFSNLAPAATSGEQMLSIRKIDMDALKLENGAMRFALPGDGTLKIVEAEFPWFSGTIGAYNSQMSIEGGKSETTLQIDNVDLSELLAYLNIEGLSGEGVVEGVLPIVFEGGKASVNSGILSSKGPGVVRYKGDTTDAAAQASDQAALAFDILRELRFEKLAATIDGPLDGTIDFNILFEGRSDIPVRTGGKTQRIDSPVKYRVTIKAPLLSLIEQAALSTNVRMQIDRARKEKAGETEQQ